MTLNYGSSDGGPLIVHKQFNTVFDKLRSKADPLISPTGAETVTIKNVLTFSTNNSPARKGDRKKGRKILKRDLKFQGNFVFNKNHRRAKTATHSNTLSL